MGILSFKRWALLACLGAVSTFAQNQQKEFLGLKCESYISKMLGRAVKYCRHRTRPDLPELAYEPVVYFFHGIGGNAQTWVDNGYAEAVDILSREENFPPFSWVSFDTDKMSFFSDVQNRHTGPEAYESWLIQEFMPYVEQKFNLCRERKCRSTAGISMGGFGSLKTALKHPDLFSAMAANSGALAPFNVYDPFTDWMAYFARHPIGSLKGQVLLSQVKRVFATREDFDENDAAKLTESFKNLAKFPALYMDVGGQDYFGFQEGFFRLRGILDQRKIPYTQEFIPDGTHDVFWDRRWWLVRWVRDQVLKQDQSKKPKNRNTLIAP